MSLFLNTKSIADVPEADVHLLACQIEYTGNAKVSSYFRTTIRNADDKNDLTATFRGRSLCGKVLNVPDGYTGLVLKENQKPFMEEEDRKLHATHQFDKFTYWNLDMLPSDNDAVIKAMNWLEISQAIHSTEGNSGSPECVKGER